MNRKILFVAIGVAVLAVFVCLVASMFIFRGGREGAAPAGAPAPTPTPEIFYFEAPPPEATGEASESAAPTSEPAEGEPGDVPLPTEPPPPAVVPPDTQGSAGAPVEPAVAAEAVSLAEKVQAEFARLGKGNILYNPPTEMTVGESERVEVRITQGGQEALQAEPLKGSGAPQIEQIPVASFMKVRLTGDGFEIMPLSSEEQVVVQDGYTEWAWDVTPQKSGDHRLAITVIARVKLQGFSDEQKDLDIIERDIHVRVNPAHSVRTFFADNMSWILPTILIPLALALGNRAWKRYKSRAKGST